MTTRLEAAILGCKAATLAGKSGYAAAQFILKLYGYSNKQLGDGVNRIAYSFGRRFILKTSKRLPLVNNANELEAAEIKAGNPDDCIGVLYYDSTTDLLFMEKAHSIFSLQKKFSSGRVDVSENVCSGCQDKHKLRAVGINNPDNCRMCYLESNYSDCHTGNVGVTGKGAMVMIDFISND